MVARRTFRMHRPRVEQRADLGEGSSVVGEWTTVHGCDARRWAVEPENHPHGRGLPGAVRAEKAGDHTRAHCEAECVYRDRRAVKLGEGVNIDHEPIMRQWRVAVVLLPQASALLRSQ